MEGPQQYGDLGIVLGNHHGFTVSSMLTWGLYSGRICVDSSVSKWELYTGTITWVKYAHKGT